MKCNGSGMMAILHEGGAKVQCFECGAWCNAGRQVGNGFAEILPHSAIPKRVLGIRAVAPTETLTPSEKALAKMLDAWKQWPGVAFPRTPMCDALVGVTLLLEAHGLTIGDDTTEAGDVLLARAKKAGVL